MTTAAPPAPETPGSIEALKRVRATEVEWDEKLRVAKEASEAALRRLREETDATVKNVQDEVDAERTAKVLASRSDADQGAAEILAEGAQAADQAARGEGKHPADRRDEILTAVLDGFWGD